MIGIWNALGALARTMLERKVEYRKKKQAAECRPNYSRLHKLKMKSPVLFVTVYICTGKL